MSICTNTKSIIYKKSTMTYFLFQTRKPGSACSASVATSAAKKVANFPLDVCHAQFYLNSFVATVKQLNII